MSHSSKKNPVVLSIGIMAGNEEDSIQTTLESLFRQTVFERLTVRHQQCEVVVVIPACTDRTIALTRSVFDRMEREHEWSDGFTLRLIDLPDAGKANAWNRFVHEFSAVEARFICTMEPNIVFHHRDTIYNLMSTLERRPHVPASTGRQCSDLMFKERRTWSERLSLATSAMTGAEARRICRQLFCVRTNVARNLVIPRDLETSEDGFIKEIICTDFLTRDGSTTRIAVAPEAAHIFEANVTAQQVLEAQTRQMLGQAAVHVAIEYLKTLPWNDRVNLAETIRRLESRDPDWLKRLIAEHLRAQRFSWQLVPGMVKTRFRRLWRLSPWQRVTHFPAACAAVAVTFVASASARRSLQKGMTPYLAKAATSAPISVPQTAK